MKTVKIIAVIAAAALAASCASAKVTQSTSVLPGGLKIAVAPGGGAIADSVGIALFKRGYLVVESGQMTRLLARAGIAASELMKPPGLSFLRQRGFDAVLMLQAVMAADGTPNNVTISVRAVASGGEISGVSWKNGRGGARGSLADKSMRVGTQEAVRQIVEALLRGAG
jgi:hypothetical protein